LAVPPETGEAISPVIAGGLGFMAKGNAPNPKAAVLISRGQGFSRPEQGVWPRPGPVSPK